MDTLNPHIHPFLKHLKGCQEWPPSVQMLHCNMARKMLLPTEPTAVSDETALSKLFSLWLE